MTLVRHHRNRWWIVLVMIVGSMLATAAASTCEMIEEGCSAISSGISADSSRPLSDAARVLEPGRLVNADRPAGSVVAPSCCGQRTHPGVYGSHPLNVPPVRIGHRALKSRHVRALRLIRPHVSPPHPADSLQIGTGHPSSESSVILPGDEPNDDTTSEDTDDDDDSWDEVAANDDTADGPIVACVWETGPCLCVLGSELVTFRIATRSTLFPTRQRLRC